MCHPRLSLGGAQTSFLAASSKANIWHRRLGHPGTTMMRKMILILSGHLYGLKQSGRAWYPHLKSFLISHGFQTHPALPCVFVLKDTTGFVVLVVYR
jgi:hypothetical protein